MPFELIWTGRSKKDLNLINKGTTARIVEKAEMLAIQEIVFLEKVRGTKYYKLRAGDYRILVEKFPATKRLFIARVGHRRNTYKKI